jgi:hypothetical protein
MNFLIRYLEARDDKDWITKDEQLWTPPKKPPEQSREEKTKGFTYR